MDELHQIELFEGISDEEYAWIRENSYEVFLDRGEFFHRMGEPVDNFYITLEGELQITRMVSGKEAVVGTTPRGIIGGELALLNGTLSEVTSRAIMPSRLMVFDEPAFRMLFGACPTVGMRVLRITAERMSMISNFSKQQEKMAALGKLSAGLAHELNNPAAAARRASSTLREMLPTLQEQAMALCALGLDETQLKSLNVFQQDAINNAGDLEPLSPLEQSDREDELADWLDEIGLQNGYEMASTFVSAHVLIAHFPEGSTAGALNWMNSALSVADLLCEIEDSTTRISGLVQAVKEYTYMDQAAYQEVDIHKGLENTVRVLNHKLKKLTVERQYDPELPKVMGRGGELNQVWTNLIDNAADALETKGATNGHAPTIRLITRCENDFAMIEVTDNGPGIPETAMPRLFEPFFTTKEVGKGSGLGLDIVYRIIQQHNGTISVQSQPGNTRFIVRLPVNGATG
jgi:signal transduction histidine kinase